jgi:hypothetical protein
MTFDLGDGGQVVVSSDMGKIRLSLWACRGSLGKEMSPEQAEEIGLTLYCLGRKAKRARKG